MPYRALIRKNEALFASWAFSPLHLWQTQSTDLSGKRQENHEGPLLDDLASKYLGLFAAKGLLLLLAVHKGTG